MPAFAIGLYKSGGGHEGAVDVRIPLHVVQPGHGNYDERGGTDGVRASRRARAGGRVHGISTTGERLRRIPEALHIGGSDTRSVNAWTGPMNPFVFAHLLVYDGSRGDDVVRG